MKRCFHGEDRIYATQVEKSLVDKRKCSVKSTSEDKRESKRQVGPLALTENDNSRNQYSGRVED